MPTEQESDETDVAERRASERRASVLEKAAVRVTAAKETPSVRETDGLRRRRTSRAVYLLKEGYFTRQRLSWRYRSD